MVYDIIEFMNKSLQQTVTWITVESEQAGQRLDNFLRSRCKDLPKSHLYRIIRKGEVRVNKKRADPDYRLIAGDVVRVPPMRVSVSTPATPKQGTINLLQQQILYEDIGLLVVNKPSGMAVHGGSGISLGVIETLRAARPQQKSLELVHRLDRETSGCLLIAKKTSALRSLHDQLRNNAMKKTYLCLVQGTWPANIKKVAAALEKNQLRSGERMVNVSENGKKALTEFQIIQRFAQVTLLEARPHTGRTHQIRVHAVHAGHPIVGDDKYGDKDFNKLMRAYGCNRLFLHASALQFVLPDSGETISVKAELPADLEKCLQRLVK